MAIMNYGTADSYEVTPEQFKEINALLNRSRVLFLDVQSGRYTLHEKIAIQREAKRLREQAMAIGKPEAAQS